MRYKRESPTWDTHSLLSKNSATTSVVPMPEYCGWLRAASKMDRFALEEFALAICSTWVSPLSGSTSINALPGSTRLVSDDTTATAMPLATSPAL
jgi:hypothetical protein